MYDTKFSYLKKKLYKSEKRVRFTCNISVTSAADCTMVLGQSFFVVSPTIWSNHKKCSLLTERIESGNHGNSPDGFVIGGQHFLSSHFQI